MAAGVPEKAASAFRTIGEVAGETGLPQHVLRYWETRFAQLRPLKRAGNRRYYRPDDVALVHRIHTLLNRDGYTIRGVQKLLDGAKPSPASAVGPSAPADLAAVRDLLAQALADDR
ncbi:MerR family transcriptional regulator [Sphingomonas koreensis]|nr:MerR family transcriptional regulator [Sphingomonas koreensis]